MALVFLYMTLFRIFSLVFFSALIFNVAEAGDAPLNLLSTSGGIASPSVQSALGENPGGLPNNEDSKIDAAVVRGLTNTTWGGGASFFTGNGKVGGGIALQGFNTQANSPGRVALLNYGVGTKIPKINMAFGFNGTTRLFKKGEVQGTGTGTTWCVDTGVIFNPDGDTRIGFAVFQLLAGVDAIAAGIAQKVTNNSMLVLDGAMTNGQKNFIIKPGIKVGLDVFQISTSYGHVLGQKSWTWIRPGLEFGAGVFLGKSFRLYGYVNHFATALLGLSWYL